MTTIVITDKMIVTDTKQITNEQGCASSTIEYQPKFVKSEDNKFIITSSGVFNYDIDPLLINTISSKIELIISCYLNMDELINGAVHDIEFNEFLLGLQFEVTKLLSSRPGKENDHNAANFITIITSTHTLTIGTNTLSDLMFFRKNGLQGKVPSKDDIRWSVSETNISGLRKLLQDFDDDVLEESSGVISGSTHETKLDIPRALHICKTGNLINNEIINYMVVGSGCNFALLALENNNTDPIDAVKFACNSDTMSGYNSKGLGIHKHSELSKLNLLSKEKLINLIKG